MLARAKVLGNLSSHRGERLLQLHQRFYQLGSPIDKVKTQLEVISSTACEWITWHRQDGSI